jgi:hypothetical protein
MHSPCWITKAADTYSEYAILFGFTLQQWLRERASLYVICTFCLVKHDVSAVQPVFNVVRGTEYFVSLYFSDRES